MKISPENARILAKGLAQSATAIRTLSKFMLRLAETEEDLVFPTSWSVGGTGTKSPEIGTKSSENQDPGTKSPEIPEIGTIYEKHGEQPEPKWNVDDEKLAEQFINAKTKFGSRARSHSSFVNSLWRHSRSTSR